VTFRPAGCEQSRSAAFVFRNQARTQGRQEVKAKGLAGDDRWFYIQDGMNKT
jgi:hypothetical protein